MEESLPNRPYKLYKGGCYSSAGVLYEVYVVPFNAGSEGPELSLHVKCEFTVDVNGGEACYSESQFRLKRDSADELSGIEDLALWLRGVAEVPLRVAKAAVKLAGRVSGLYPSATDATAFIRVINFLGKPLDELMRWWLDDRYSTAALTARAAVDALDKVVIRVPEESCVVCMDTFSVGSEVTRMPCSHVFHGDCIVQWLKIRPLCPLCRFQLPI